MPLYNLPGFRVGYEACSSFGNRKQALQPSASSFWTMGRTMTQTSLETLQKLRTDTEAFEPDPPSFYNFVPETMNVHLRLFSVDPTDRVEKVSDVASPNYSNDPERDFASLVPSAFSLQT